MGTSYIHWRIITDVGVTVRCARYWGEQRVYQIAVEIHAAHICGAGNQMYGMVIRIPVVVLVNPIGRATDDLPIVPPLHRQYRQHGRVATCVRVKDMATWHIRDEYGVCCSDIEGAFADIHDKPIRLPCIKIYRMGCHGGTGSICNREGRAIHNAGK